MPSLHHSLSTCGSPLAHPSLGSTRDLWPYGFTGLPHPAGSTLVSRHSAYIMDLWTFRSLHPFVFSRLLGSLSHRLYRSPQALCHPRTLITTAPPRSSVPSGLGLLPGLHYHRINCCQLSPWCCQPRFHHGFFFSFFLILTPAHPSYDCLFLLK